MSKNSEIEKLISEEELKKLKEFKEILSKDFPEESKDSNTCYRFLKARKFDFEAAETQFRNRMKWYTEEMKPNKITVKDVQGEIDFGKSFLYGKDKNKRPILIVKAGRHIPDSETADTTWKLILLLVEKCITEMPPPPHNQFLVIYDRDGFSRQNFDLGLIRKFVDLGNNYPELLGRVFVLHSNWLFHMLFAIASQFMDPVTKDKIKLAEIDELFEYIDKSNLLPEHKGEKLNKELLFPDCTPLDKFYKE